MNKKELLLDQALDLFAAKGYASVGVQAIAVAAGVQKPTLYHYFGSKEGLLRALLERSLVPELEALEEAAAYAGDLPLALERVARCSFRFAHSQETLCRFLLSSVFGPPESELGRVFAPFLSRRHRQLSGLFAAAAHQHGNMRGRHELHAIAFQGALDSAIAAHWHDPRLTLDEQDAFLVCKYFMHGILS